MKQNPNTRVQIESQTAVLGCMLIDARTHGDIFAKVHDRDFSSEHFRNIFRTARSIFHEGKPLDAVTLLHQLGEEYRQTLTEIIEVTPTAANCSEYIDLLLESAKLGRLQDLGLQLTQAATLEEAALIAGRLAEIETYNSGMQAVPISKGITEFFARQNSKPEYIQLGITKIDQKLFAELGDYIVLGGRPSDGKTALALQMALTLSKKYRVGIFSLETNHDKLYDRLLTNACILDFSKVKKREMSEDDFSRIASMTSDLCGHDLDVISAAGRTIDEIQSYALAHRYQIVMVDYLQLIRTTARNSTREQEVAAISIGLQRLAHQHGILVIALAQLTREEKKGQQTAAPRMSSLRESGQIEQDADAIMLLYRLNPNDPDSERRLKLAKNKEGRIGYVDLQFIGAQQSFVEQMPPMKLPPLPKRPKPPKDPQMSLSDKPPIINPEPLGEEAES